MLTLLLAAMLLAAEPPAPPASTDLTLLSYNIWVGGERGHEDPLESRRLTLAVMRRAEADVICVQEAGGLGPWYAERLGFACVELDRGRAILSRHPIAETTAGRFGARIEHPAAGSVWVFDVHFPHAPYQPYQLAGIPYHDGRFIETAAEAVTEARLARGAAALSCLTDLDPALRSGRPVFLAGDFNEPSHMDWTDAAAVAGVHAIAVPWPTTRTFAEAGMRDAWRAVHPDPVTRPGFTWTPRPGAREVHDRIDLVLSGGPGVEARVAGLVGEESIDGYPSDHRAVRVEFELPAASDADPGDR